MYNTTLEALTIIIPILAFLNVFLLFRYKSNANFVMGLNKPSKLYNKTGQKFYLVKAIDTSIGISLPKQYSYCLEVSKRSLLNKLFKHSRASKELQSNNQSFNQEYYISSEDISFCTNLYNDQSAQDIINKLFELRITGLYTDDKMIWVSTKHCSEETTEYIVNGIQSLLTIIEKLNYSIEKSILTQKWNLIIKISVWFYYITGSIALYNIFYDKVLTYGMFKYSLEYSIPIAVLLSTVILKIFLKTSKIYRAAIYSVIILLPIVSLGVYDAIYVLNIQLDNSKTNIHVEKVIDKEKKYRRKSGNSYYIITTPFLDGRNKYKLKDSRYLYNCLNIGDEVRILVQEGFFGFKWIDSEIPIKKCN